jgi:N-acetyl sugar amidotransferase
MSERLRVLNNLRLCTRCLLPETQETSVFDDQGVCNVCRQIEYKQKQVDWAAKRREFEELLNQYRGKYTYDCIVPFSGGKDSTYTLYCLVREFGLKPLVVSFDHGFFRPVTLVNNERTLKILGVDFLKFRPNWRVVQKLMLEALKRKGDFCWHCHTGCFAYPMQIALKFRVPLVIWGEPSAEYASYYTYEDQEEVDERRFNRFVNLGITAEDMHGMLDGTVTMQDLEPFRYPSVKDLRAINCRSVCLGSYIPWDVKKHVSIIKHELGWQENDVEGVPKAYRYEKVECAMQGVRDYLKFIKRGFGRTTHLVSIDIRNGRLSREEAMKLVQEHDGKRPASLDIFLEYVGLTEEEFMAIALQHIVSPHVHDPKSVLPGEKLRDQDQWDRS